jgi:hypothetical protein
MIRMLPATPNITKKGKIILTLYINLAHEKSCIYFRSGSFIYRVAVFDRHLGASNNRILPSGVCVKRVTSLMGG